MSAPARLKLIRGLTRSVRTGRLVFLRYPTERDRREFIALRRASQAFLKRWEPIPPAGFDSFGDDGFDRELDLRHTPTDERLLICRLEDGVILGKLSIGGITRGPAQSCHIGYWMAEAFAGRGYMTEAIGLGLRHAFETLKLHRVEASIQPNNDASRAVVRRNGFRLEGISKRFLKIRGKWCDHERWAKCREDR